MVTLKDVAEAAGVSISTASRALRGKAVAPKTRARVEKVAQQLGFSPNVLAQGLATQKTRTLGLLVPDITNPVFSDIAFGLESYLRDEDYTLILCNTDDRSDRERAYLRMLLSRRVDGIVMASSAADSSDTCSRTELLCNASCPVVLVNCEPITGLHAMLVNAERAAYLATEHLAKQGRKHIVSLQGSDAFWFSRIRLNGYTKALSDYGLAGSETTLVGCFRRETAAKAFGELIDSRESIDGIICDNDLMAIGVLQEAKRRGIGIPDDVAVVGSGNTSLCELVEPALSSVGYDNVILGKEVGRLIIDIAESDRPPFVISYEPTLTARASSTASGDSEPSETDQLQGGDL